MQDNKVELKTSAYTITLVLGLLNGESKFISLLRVHCEKYSLGKTEAFQDFSTTLSSSLKREAECGGGF